MGFNDTKIKLDHLILQNFYDNILPFAVFVCSNKGMVDGMADWKNRFFINIFLWHQVEVSPFTLRSTVLRNDPAVPHDHCRDLCLRSLPMHSPTPK